MKRNILNVLRNISLFNQFSAEYLFYKTLQIVQFIYSSNYWTKKVGPQMQKNTAPNPTM